MIEINLGKGYYQCDKECIYNIKGEGDCFKDVSSIKFYEKIPLDCPNKDDVCYYCQYKALTLYEHSKGYKCSVTGERVQGFDKACEHYRLSDHVLTPEEEEIVYKELLK